MNSFTAALDAMPLDGSHCSASIHLDTVLKTKNIHNYMPLIPILAEWQPFWDLFACFLAEVDQETIEAIRTEILAANELE